MNELIKLQSQTIDGNTVETVSARELYDALGLDKSNWSRWAKQNIVNNPFAVENGDYLGFVIMTNGNETTDYALVLDFAKKLAMQVKTEKGELVRNYFIKCEKQLQSNQAQLPTDPFLLIAHFAQQAYLMQQKQTEMDNRLIKVEQKQQQLNQDNDHFTIKGFCSLHGIDLSNGKMSALSKKAKKLSDVRDYVYHEITDPRWGKVKTYHKDILTELFQMQNLL